MPKFQVNGDWQLSEDGRTFVYCTGVKRLAQRIRIGFHYVLNTYKYDRNLGLPWFDQILVKSNMVDFESTMRSYLLSHPEVTRIDKFEMFFDPSTRVIRVEYRLFTTVGPITDTVPYAIEAS